MEINIIRPDNKCDSSPFELDEYVINGCYFFEYVDRNNESFDPDEMYRINLPLDAVIIDDIHYLTKSNVNANVFCIEELNILEENH